jgi:DNA-binding XRE family transcriptional regulator
MAELMTKIPTSSEALESARTFQILVTEAEQGARLQRARRDRAIRIALDNGITQYRIAKTLGISEQAIAKIKRQFPQTPYREAPALTMARPRTLAEQVGWPER